MSSLRRCYRVYTYDAAHTVVTADVLEAASDNEAIAKAEAAAFGTKCELWLGRRLVAQFEAARQQA